MNALPCPWCNLFPHVEEYGFATCQNPNCITHKMGSLPIDVWNAQLTTMNLINENNRLRALLGLAAVRIFF
jgi:hypothetical protein